LVILSKEDQSCGAGMGGIVLAGQNIVVDVEPGISVEVVRQTPANDRGVAVDVYAFNRKRSARLASEASVEQAGLVEELMPPKASSFQRKHAAAGALETGNQTRTKKASEGIGMDSANIEVD
jgi:hypothetical protein